MDKQSIVEEIQSYLVAAQKELSNWLTMLLPRVGEDWWEKCVLENLTISQIKQLEEKEHKFDQLGLGILLRIADKSWYTMSSVAYLKRNEREYIKNMIKVNYNCLHYTNGEISKDNLINDINIMIDFFEGIIITNVYTKKLMAFRAKVEKEDFTAFVKTNDECLLDSFKSVENSDIKAMDTVYLVGEPETNGLVMSVEVVNGLKKYLVFVNGKQKTFYDGQIKKVSAAETENWIDIDTLKSKFTAYEINNPSINNLYSLNAARIDFVPYQFRPALKMIKSDEPKILIADSVGVGKTIEAGLLIKELEARTDVENILIICPKPLVAERKWELEMKRFDEDFIQIDSGILQETINDAYLDEGWPSRYNKVIVPYSILSGKIYNGDKTHGGVKYGLLDLDPAPHFDLVIIDEAHHIRNGSMEKEKAFAYKCVRYFCEHADAVVMLTATPLQTSDNDLFTLLNLLRPDVVMDKDVFNMMSRPNEYIYRCSHIVRKAEEGWQSAACEELQDIKNTQWGENVVARNPLYKSVLERLKQDVITREERVKLISDIESLHSFNTMLNRTRRRDIQDFCIRRAYTVETEFTPLQAELHDELLEFESRALAQLHDERFVPFMMSTIKRQAASCIFGLAPQIKDIVNRRFGQFDEDADIDEEFSIDGKISNTLYSLAQNVLQLAENLPEDDPKLDSIIKILEDKQELANNKVILFSSFRHTLNYLYQKLLNRGFRVAQINGSVKDEDRRILRSRFELDKNNPDALDLLLFTEVGSEGLDYQFCDTMINYDLPWNPMRIEQRIGRIDRRGQQSEAVSIYNIITPNTVDADVYSRCLMRIGVFERSIGECEEVLSQIGSSIEKIALNIELSPEERKIKLEQIADNEIRHMLELSKLEDEERALFGFDLSNYTTSQEIKDAESPWLSADNIQKLVDRYLQARLGKGQYILGNEDLKVLNLEKDNRIKLLDDLRTLANMKYLSKKKWEAYLKGRTTKHDITFQSDTAAKEPKASFITPMHPLVQQAAKYFANDETAYIHLEYYSRELPQGRYAFSVYAWDYVGIQPSFKIVSVCENEEVSKELLNIIQLASNGQPIEHEDDLWSDLETKHIKLWQADKEKYLLEIANVANYKLESINSNFKNRKRNLEQKIQESFDNKITRMHRSELKAATENYNAKVSEINDKAAKADILTECIVKGIIDIKKG